MISAASSAARLLSSLLPFYDDFDSFTVVVFVFSGYGGAMISFENSVYVKNKKYQFDEV